MYCDVLRLIFIVVCIKRYVKSKNQFFSKWQLNVFLVLYNVLGLGNFGKDMNFLKIVNIGILMYGYVFQQMGVGVQIRVIRIGSKCRYLLSYFIGYGCNFLYLLNGKQVVQLIYYEF